MSEEQKTVQKVETAVTQPEVTSAPVTEVDYEALLAKKDAELEIVRAKKDQYKKGILRAKGKLPEEDNTPEELDALIDRKVQEKLLSTQEAQIQAEQSLIIKNLAKRNKELEVALKNRSQITQASAPGSNNDKPEVTTDSYFSNEQIQALKAKGWSDKKIEQAKVNMKKPSGPRP